MSNNTANSTDKIKEFYLNDIVYRFDKHKRIIFGVVTDSYELSADMDEFHSLQKGQIRVLWNNNSREQTWMQNKLYLMNRNIIPGEVVRRLEKGKETQRGYCKENKEVVTVQIVGTEKVIEHIPADRLKKVKRYYIDDPVCLGDKCGRIENIEEEITMQSSCGSIVQVLTSVNHDLDDYWSCRKKNKFTVDVYYPGQEVICTPSNLTQPNWIKKSKTMRKNINLKQRFTVQEVEDFVIEVAWYSNNGYSNLTELSHDEIKQLSVIEHPCDCTLELAERRLLKLGSNDVLIKKKDWVKKMSMMYRPDMTKVRHICSAKNKYRVPLLRSTSVPYSTPESQQEPEEDWWTEEGEEFDDNDTSSQNTTPTKSRKRHYPPKLRDLTPGHTLAVEVIFVESKLTVVWQDGTEEEDIPSTQLYYSISLDDHEFFPGEWVVYDKSEVEFEGKYGVVQHANYLERTASVKWFSYSEEEKLPHELFVKEMSVYDLQKHSKYAFRPGIIVKSKSRTEDRMGKVIDSSPQGFVIVRWINNVEENCWPQDIEVIPETSDYDYSEEDSSDEEDQVSWETESVESYAGDNTDEISLQKMAARLDFLRSRVVYLKNAFKQHPVAENFTFVKDLLTIYENSSYFDKFLGTAFFSLKSKHFQALLAQVKETAKTLGIELKGRLFSNDSLSLSVTKIKVAEKETISKMIKLENKINAQLEKDASPTVESPTSELFESSSKSVDSKDNMCVELLSMIKIRMDLIYAEIISRIGGPQVFTVITQASENSIESQQTPLPSYPTTPEDFFNDISPLKQLKSVASTPKTSATTTSEAPPEGASTDSYRITEEANANHHFLTSKFQPLDLQQFLKSIQKEYKLLKDSLPEGVWVRSFENRIDLLSVMIRGPAKTPYEDGLFLFDIQFSTDYPRSPPLVHYISYNSERLNPNLYVEGKVCVSLLGTWTGRGTEVWGPGSTLLQLIVSIQGLILVSEPYYNEAGYEKQADTQQGYENSRTYNELVVLKLVQSMTEMLLNPPEVFKQEVFTHFEQNGQKLCDRLQSYCQDNADVKPPEFPLMPVSKGLKLSLSSAIHRFQEVLKTVQDK